jgi:hypothetical protein
MNRDAWVEVWRLFHKLWGKAASGTYDKGTWMQLQTILNKSETEDNQKTDP